MALKEEQFCLEGRVLQGEKILRLAQVRLDQKTDEGLVPALERALRKLCTCLDLPLPLWLDKNTKEFARFRQTFFFAEQFTEEVKFSRFQIRLLEE
ncbi:MAG: hypothetical protein Q4P08_00400 [Eubacteriales bacterium]|nr:hypothetical protein [Eubacteriales bacterium]